MTWRNRNLFKKKAVPVQKFNMGGSVRGVEALKNVAPTLSTFDYDNAVNMMGGGMVDMPVQQMNTGGMPLEMLVHVPRFVISKQFDTFTLIWHLLCL